MTRIKRPKLYEEVMIRIEEMIKTNQLKEGDRLQSEKELAELFGVSRMAIREALSALQSAGLIEVRHGSGIYLKEINDKLANPITLRLLTGSENLLNILELRRGLETEGAYLAAGRAEESDLEKIEDVLQKMESELNVGGSAHHEDFKFHCSLIRATHNPVFSKVFDAIANIFYEGLRSSHEIFTQSLGPRFVVLEEHRKIFDHIKHGEAEAARDAMRVHLGNVEAKLKMQFKKK
ncbi:MAG: FadR/GntR family transcriptional regulator [Bacillota bacterium]